MLYLGTASGPRVRQAMADGHLGQMVTPQSGNRVVEGVRWVLDNGCFSASWDEHHWQATMDRLMGTRGCLFAVAPDVVGSAEATMELWRRWWTVPMRRGFPVAYVAQDGCWFIPEGPSALFIGGSTEWKLGPEARALAAAAKREGLWVHMGRVNSLRRLRYAADIGCDSVDGTYLAFGPDKNLPTLFTWIDPDQPGLFGGVA
jgi:hypothetical protein